jgi:hypothetical protein
MCPRETERTKTVPNGLSPNRELAVAARRFGKATQADSTLKILLLVDPIRAFSDAGIELSRRARKLLRRQHREPRYGDSELYDYIKSNPSALSWIESIELGRPKAFSNDTSREPSDRRRA